jgi:hypothetical protein
MTGNNWVSPVLGPVSEMLKTALLTNDDPQRHSPEEFVKKICAARYGARLETFPSRIFALLDNNVRLCFGVIDRIWHALGSRVQHRYCWISAIARSLSSTPGDMYLAETL